MFDESEYPPKYIRAENFPLDFINRNMSPNGSAQDLLPYCGGGLLFIAASMLKSRISALVQHPWRLKALRATSLPHTDKMVVNTEL